MANYIIKLYGVPPIEWFAKVLNVINVCHIGTVSANLIIAGALRHKLSQAIELLHPAQ